MNDRVKLYFRDIRKRQSDLNEEHAHRSAHDGRDAVDALMEAKIRAEWYDLEPRFVRLRVVNDDAFQGDWLIDPDDLKQKRYPAPEKYEDYQNPNRKRKRIENMRARIASEKGVWDRIERDGATGIIAEFRTEECDCPDAGTDRCKHGWEHADSCWGFVGDDWENSGYDLDHMVNAINAYKAALEAIEDEKVAHYF